MISACRFMCTRGGKCCFEFYDFITSVPVRINILDSVYARPLFLVYRKLLAREKETPHAQFILRLSNSASSIAHLLLAKFIQIPRETKSSKQASPDITSACSNHAGRNQISHYHPCGCGHRGRWVLNDYGMQQQILGRLLRRQRLR